MSKPQSMIISKAQNGYMVAKWSAGQEKYQADEVMVFEDWSGLLHYITRHLAPDFGAQMLIDSKVVGLKVMSMALTAGV
jgi:hypothetical protein